MLSLSCNVTFFIPVVLSICSSQAVGGNPQISLQPHLNLAIIVEGICIELSWPIVVHNVMAIAVDVLP